MKEEINAAVKDLAVMMGIKIEELYQEFLQKVNDPREELPEAADKNGPTEEDYTMLAAQLIGNKLPLK